MWVLSCGLIAILGGVMLYGLLHAIMGVVMSGLMFARLFLIPLWRTLGEQESSNAAVTNPN